MDQNNNSDSNQIPQVPASDSQTPMSIAPQSETPLSPAVESETTMTIIPASEIENKVATHNETPLENTYVSVSSISQDSPESSIFNQNLTPTTTSAIEPALPETQVVETQSVSTISVQEPETKPLSTETFSTYQPYPTITETTMNPQLTNTTPDSNIPSEINSAGNGNDNSKKIFVIGGGVLGVVLLGVISYIIYSSFTIPASEEQENLETQTSQTTQESEEAVLENNGVTEYKNNIAEVENSYLEIRGKIIEGFNNFSDPTTPNLFNELSEKSISTFSRLSIIRNPENTSELHESLVANMASLNDVLEKIAEGAKIGDTNLINSQIATLNTNVNELDRIFGEIKNLN
jgi:hypothetical protein